ncbi:uncharacterized protein LOC134929489 [Pseudophryne corroboree]|uniref:uncharacterized protein LOC134929489 n=1 Tax=Pseudophryne corroboree TaxID=495146 RepID=UPI003081EE16
MPSAFALCRSDYLYYRKLYYCPIWWSVPSINLTLIASCSQSCNAFWDEEAGISLSTSLMVPDSHALHGSNSHIAFDDPGIITEDAQQERDQETFTLHLQPIDPTQPTTPQDIPQPPQTSHSPQLSTTQVDTQMGPEFWSHWSSQQVQYCASLNTHSQYLSSLPHHLPRLSRNSGRLIVQVGRIANSMEQMRADNTQMQSNLQRILDDQQRQQQSLIQIIQHNQMINDNLSRMIANNTAANTQLTASLNNLSQSLSVLASHHATSSSGTMTPSHTPVHSPVRRSSRTRTNEPAHSSAPSTHKKKH